MNKFICSLVLVCIGITSSFAQSTISKTWSFESVTDSTEQSVLEVQAENDYLKLEDGSFEYFLKGADSTVASGNYVYQNEILVFFYDSPRDSIQNFRVSELSDSTLVLSANNTIFRLTETPGRVEEVLPIEATKELIPSQGISLNSVARGAIGMVSLILLAFIFSSNRRKINWKTVALGLSAQLLLAFGVLKVEFVQKIFEFVGQIFVLILNFTAAGSEFLLGGMMDVDSFGFIFIFQVLPTIIFFSALTSVLFYLGVIQVVVKGMAVVLTKLLGISGPESLSVTGNIFLGQTEAPLMIKAYLERMTRSEILLVMVGGMATVAGGVLAAYIGFLGGDDPALRLEFAKHLLAASVMAAPGAVVVSKCFIRRLRK